LVKNRKKCNPTQFCQNQYIIYTSEKSSPKFGATFIIFLTTNVNHRRICSPWFSIERHDFALKIDLDLQFHFPRVHACTCTCTQNKLFGKSGKKMFCVGKLYKWTPIEIELYSIYGGRSTKGFLLQTSFLRREVPVSMHVLWLLWRSTHVRQWFEIFRDCNRYVKTLQCYKTLWYSLPNKVVCYQASESDCHRKENEISTRLKFAYAHQPLGLFTKNTNFVSCDQICVVRPKLKPFNSFCITKFWVVVPIYLCVNRS
jgi:hypothetical protein